MDVILQKFAGKIDAQSLVKTVEDLKIEYIDDGLTKEDIPPILSRLMLETIKFKKLPGPQKKKLVIGILNYLIEQIDEGEKDSEFEVVLKSIVPPMVDSFAAMLKAKKQMAKCLPCLA
jgi:hypothetical protein|tara:strand:+ start:927 stop:1280 length:354 start_codon:yes stop_codon:yes gene_type:complete